MYISEIRSVRMVYYFFLVFHVLVILSDLSEWYILVFQVLVILSYLMCEDDVISCFTCTCNLILSVGDHVFLFYMYL